MDFLEAIKAHSAWKKRLAAYVAKPDHSLNPVEAGAEDQCELGRWIKGEGQKHASSPFFAELVIKHAAFHKAAALVIEQVDRGEKVDEEIALGAKSPFGLASEGVVHALMMLNWLSGR